MDDPPCDPSRRYLLLPCTFFQRHDLELRFRLIRNPNSGRVEANKTHLRDLGVNGRLRASRQIIRDGDPVLAVRWNLNSRRERPWTDRLRRCPLLAPVEQTHGYPALAHPASYSDQRPLGQLVAAGHHGIS